MIHSCIKTYTTAAISGRSNIFAVTQTLGHRAGHALQFQDCRCCCLRLGTTLALVVKHCIAQTWNLFNEDLVSFLNLVFPYTSTFIPMLSIKRTIHYQGWISIHMKCNFSPNRSVHICVDKDCLRQSKRFVNSRTRTSEIFVQSK